MCIRDRINPEQKEQVLRLGKELPKVFSKIPGCTHLVEHAIETDPGVVVRSNERLWPRQLASVIEKEVDEMIKLGVIEPAKGPWRSYPVMVRKPDGSLRFCIDIRKVNAVSKFNVYPMPKIGDLLDHLGGAQYLSSIHLNKGYWQIPVRPQDREKTAFCTPKGLYQFVKMPFGLHGVAVTFQRLMDQVLTPLRDCEPRGAVVKPLYCS